MQHQQVSGNYIACGVYFGLHSTLAQNPKQGRVRPCNTQVQHSPILQWLTQDDRNPL